jgi:uncharacterized membrane protein
MMMNLTSAGTLHSVLAMFCIAVGLLQLLRPKGGAGHRARGYAFVYAMLVADGAAMLIYRFTGQFNLFHAAAMVNFASIVLAIVPLLQSPRPANWRFRHYYFIAWSYVALISAAVTELVIRAGHIARGQIWIVATVASTMATLIGYVLIGRYRPERDSQPASIDTTIQQNGAPT